MAEGVLRLAESEVEGCRNFCDKDMNHNYAYYIYIDGIFNDLHVFESYEHTSVYSICNVLFTSITSLIPTDLHQETRLGL